MRNFWQDFWVYLCRESMIRTSGILILVSWFIWAVVTIVALSFGKEYIGIFGDAFGALNALFSGAALVGVIVAIYLQKQELEETRRELAASAKAHIETVEIMRAQKSRQDRAAFRRATPVLVSNYPMHGVEQTEPKRSRLVWSLTNQSGPIFMPEITVLMSEPYPFNIIWHCPRILPTGGRIEFQLVTEESIGFKTQEDFRFRLTCFDSDGFERSQTYECMPSRAETIECVEPDLRVQEFEINNEDENYEYIP